MGKAAGSAHKRQGGKGGGRAPRKTPYAHEYKSGRGGSYRGADREELLQSLLEGEAERRAAEEHEEMVDSLMARLAPHHPLRRTADPPPLPHRSSGWGRDKKGGRSAAAAPKKFAQVEDSETSDEDTAEELSSLREELVAVKAERDSFQREMLKLVKKKAGQGSDQAPEGEKVTLEMVKQLIQEAVKAGSAANTPKKGLQKAETEGVFAQVVMTDDVYHDPEGTAALLALLKVKLQEAKEVRDFGLGINIDAKLHAQCTKLGKAVGKYHFMTPEESVALVNLRKEFFPTDTTKVPGTIMPLFFRALSSRNIAVKSEQIGVTLQGDPIPLLKRE